ncbi:MAG: DNA mismatch repair protein MutS, partial [Atribacterota bacterium]
MRVFLLFQDRDFTPSGKRSSLVDDLVKDLELEVLLRAMACGDEHLFKVAKEVLLAGLDDPETILYRQDILRDCLKHVSLVRRMYDISVQAIEAKRKASFAGIFSRYPSSILAGAVRILQPLVDMLEDLRHIADEYVHEFESKGFTRFCTMLQSELPDTYLAAVRECLHDLEFTKGVLVSAELQHGCVGNNYLLRKPPAKKGWISRMWQKRLPGYS